MKVLLVLVLALAGANSAPDMRFSCSECVDEMHHLGSLVKEGAEAMTEYLQNNYCPTVDDAPECEEHIAFYYPHMLHAIVQHYFVDGAVHVCQTMGVCEARRYTCEECVVGLEWVEAYLEDPIMIAEMTVYLGHNFCLDEWENCKEDVAVHFRPMHEMTMEKFMIPTEICNSEPVCTGETAKPTHHPHTTPAA
eukprot:TRINITY_DN1674_c0_g1_i10.p1 TRINITY_DN1674_c0_g1~~TRINITY_DN1674_c0_g1_i10.p1  ORF type:complete len:193 (-),score=56.47 TRINITY_DN1674_c0_g1_i10:40-618(-)